MIETIAIKDLQPAAYNPRLIQDDNFEELKNSLQTLGIIIPILVNKKNMTIIAGHQRTKAAAAIGVDRAPCFMCDDIGIADEIFFNQMHNGTDRVFTKDNKYTGAEVRENEFLTINAQDFSIQTSKPFYVKEICNLMLRYGNIFSAVICNGIIYDGADYIKSCQLLGYKANIFFVPKEKQKDVEYFFSKSYGEYSYEKLEKRTFVQGLAQMYRNPNGKEYKNIVKENKSVLYENYVIPYIVKHPNASILDFGCGKGGYVKLLKERKYNIRGVEFYNHNVKSINVGLGHKQIDEFIAFIKDNGLFDIVVCDSVMNSVDSMDAEIAVLRVLNIVAKGKMFISGRRVETILSKVNEKASTHTKRNFYFLDKDNFSGLYRQGQWFYQHFHTKETFQKSCEKAGLEMLLFEHKYSSGCWAAILKRKRKLTESEAKAAIDFEFDLPLPNGNSYQRNKEVWEVLKKYYASSNN